jgi:PAS domain S-box-containing protein
MVADPKSSGSKFSSIIQDLQTRVTSLQSELAAQNIQTANEENLMEVLSLSLKTAMDLERSLASAERQYSDLTAALPQMLWSTLPDGSHIYFNNRWIEYTGRSLEDSYGFGWLEAFHPDDRARTLDRWHLATATGEAYEIEYRLRRADGTYGWVLGRALPLRDEKGQIARWFGSCTDIDNQKRAEELAGKQARDLAMANQKLIDAERTKSEFLSTVSHELRTPLTLILAPLESIMSTGGASNEGQLKPLLRSMYNNSLRLLQLVNGLLDFSKLEANKFEVACVPTDIVALTKSIIADFQPVIDDSNISLEFSANTSDLWVDVDRYIYERIFFNLLSNAVKFTPKQGRIIVTLNYEKSHTILEITDTGIGISKDEQHLLFKKFRQIEPSATRRFEGAGLGLALVKEFASLLHGDITVQSEKNKGSTFKVDMLLATSSTQNQIPAIGMHATPKRMYQAQMSDVAFTVPSGQNIEKPKVMIVEDNTELANYIEFLLADNYQTYIARDGEEALEVISNWAPDLVLSDVMMPRRDGLSLCRELKGRPESANLPVVLLTALTHRDALLKGWDAGADEYLFKPFHPIELQTRIRTVLAITMERRKAEAALRKSNDDLELKVAERTSSLSLVMENLRRSESIERNARIESERLSRQKDDFLITLSHELRTPMVPIMGWIEIIKSNPFDQKSTLFALETIERNAKSELQLIEDLLDTSRVITGKLVLNKNKVDLIQVVNAAAKTIELAAEAKNICLKIDTPSKPIMVIGDDRRLQQIIWNLLGNAIKFSKTGGHVSLRLEEIGSNISLSISDDGIGIKPEYLPHVFDRFSQADSSTTRYFGGLGLGLSLVRQLVEAHGGKVQAESLGIDRGAKFTVILPTGLPPSTPVVLDGDAPAEKPCAFPAESSEVVAPLKGVTVLVVDDSEDDRTLMGTVLRLQGAEVALATSAKEGIDRIISLHPNVLISDIGMPGEDGYSLLRKVRNLPPPAGTIPAIAVTAYGNPADKKQALNSGFQLHMTKPVKFDRLIEAISSLALVPSKKS